MKSHELGKKGEDIARRFLISKGFTLLETNYYCRYGELDIIAKDRESLVFVEVKCRSSSSSLEQAINPMKIRNIKRSAQSFMQKNRIFNTDYRFVVVFVLMSVDDGEPSALEMIEDPF